MATLAGIEPKAIGGGVAPGWHRVITGEISLKYIGVNKSALLEQKAFTVEGGTETPLIKHWVTPKALPIFAKYAEQLGCDEQVRATMDPEIIPTLTPLINKTCWIMVDWVKNEGKGKWYREVTNWAADSTEPPNFAKPRHTEPPFESGGASRPAQSSAAGGSPVNDDDIPF